MKISLPVLNKDELGESPQNEGGETPREPTKSSRISGPARPKYEEDRAGKRPKWIKVRMTRSKVYQDVRELVHSNKLHTVCESAACPNIGECWSRRALTFMILGNVCTRSCGFCDVMTGRPSAVDLDEPRRVSDALANLDLRYAVITSVDRDDLKDGGAGIWAETIRLIKEKCPEMGLEVLVPDFKGVEADIHTVVDAGPDVYAHNIETVDRLHTLVRPQARYLRSLKTMTVAKSRGATTKSGIMLGLGETNEEVLQTMRDLKDAGCDILNIGQYLRPSKRHLPLDRWATPEDFKMFKDEGEKMGFKHVESGPLVRSSYRADLQAEEMGLEHSWQLEDKTLKESTHQSPKP